MIGKTELMCLKKRSTSSSASSVGKVRSPWVNKNSVVWMAIQGKKSESESTYNIHIKYGSIILLVILYCGVYMAVDDALIYGPPLDCSPSCSLMSRLISMPLGPPPKNDVVRWPLTRFRVGVSALSSLTWPEVSLGSDSRRSRCARRSSKSWT